MRIRNSIRNTSFGLLTQLIGSMLNFVNRTIFIYALGINYLGVSGFFSNIISVLSLGELGVSVAITYCLYKPLAENDTDKINALMSLYEKAYRLIGIFIAIIGLCFAPFLNSFMKEKLNIPYIPIIYLLYLSNSVISYFFSYKRTLIIADQKSYINSKNQVVFSILTSVFQAMVLLITRNFIFYLTVSIIFTFLSNRSISIKANKLYPFLKTKERKELKKEDKRQVLKYIFASMTSNVGGVIVYGTDNLLISYFIGVYWVGLYSNYVLILQVVNTFLNTIFSSVLASVGNLNATDDNEKSYIMHKVIMFLNFWLYGFCAICLLNLFNPFINLWIGGEYLLDNKIILIIVINFFIYGMLNSTRIYISTLGLFWNTKYIPLIEAAINLIVSIILLKKIGISGVLIGTTISFLATVFWIEPYVLFKKGFNKPVSIFFKKYCIYFIILIATAILTGILTNLLYYTTWLSFIGKIMVCLLIPNSIFTLLFFRTSEFKYLAGIVKNLVTKIKSNQ